MPIISDFRLTHTRKKVKTKFPMKIPETQEKQQANQARSDKKWNSTMASDARNKLIEELGDDIELIIAVQIEAAAKKAKAKEEKDFLNTLSALRAKISFPKFVSE